MHITNWKNQSEKDSYCKIPVIWCSGEVKTMEITKKKDQWLLMEEGLTGRAQWIFRAVKIFYIL